VFYDLQSCDDLTHGSWTNVAANISGLGGTATNINVGPRTAAQRFYRLKLHF